MVVLVFFFKYLEISRLQAGCQYFAGNELVWAASLISSPKPYEMAFGWPKLKKKKKKTAHIVHEMS
jgi:hypothetical protein